MLLRVLEMIARRKRVRGRASPLWTAASLAAFLIRRHRRQEARDAIALREELQPGESLLISHTTQPRG
jgi:hypothetical protein